MDVEHNRSPINNINLKQLINDFRLSTQQLNLHFFPLLWCELIECRIEIHLLSRQIHLRNILIGIEIELKISMLLEEDRCRYIRNVFYHKFHFFDVVDVVEAEVDIGDMHLDGWTDEICCDIELEEFSVFDFNYVRCLFIFPRLIRVNRNINVFFFTFLQRVLF